MEALLQDLPFRCDPRRGIDTPASVRFLEDVSAYDPIIVGGGMTLILGLATISASRIPARVPYE
jgi:hypothetical protein